MANWSLPAGTPVSTNSQHPVVMVGGEQFYIDTMPEALIGTVAPAGPV